MISVPDEKMNESFYERNEKVVKNDSILNFLPVLRCPICGADLCAEDDLRSLYCVNEMKGGKRHSFDRARSGYVNLDVGHAGGGDGKELVNARTSFLESGGYEPISDAVNELLLQYISGPTVIDAGCGEGYYTNRAALVDPGLRLLGFDLSKAAINAATRSAILKGSMAAFIVGGIFDLPVKDRSAAAVINLFAPCAENEFLRVLNEEGILIVVGAGEDHLLGLKRAVYDTPYRNTPRADLPSEMKLLKTKRVAYTLRLDSNEMIRSLFSMTPYAFRTSRKDMEKLNALEMLETEVDVTVSVYRKS